MRIRAMSIITCLFAVALFSNVALSMDNTPDTIVRRYFQACESGDVNTIKSLITGRFYQRRKVLLERNEEYPEFLRHHFSGVQIEIMSTRIQSETGNAEVMLEQIFPDGSSIDATLILKKNANGNWKIDDEVLAE